MLDIIHDYWRFLLLGEFPNGPIGGVAATVLAALTTLVITFPFAVLIALARTSGRRLLSRCAAVYVYGIRCIPLLTFLLWVYFLLPFILDNPLSPFWTLVVAISLYQAAYLSEVIRSGINALPPGQIEAAKALGMSEYAIRRKVILPQALYNVIPGIVNQFSVIAKETALGSIISMNEVTLAAQKVNAFLLTQSLPVYALLALIYFLLCYAISLVVTALERRIQRKRGLTRGPGGVLEIGG